RRLRHRRGSQYRRRPGRRGGRSARAVDPVADRVRRRPRRVRRVRRAGGAGGEVRPHRSVDRRRRAPRAGAQREPPVTRVALVTGGSGGIGRAIAATLAVRGYQVALTYATSERTARGIADGIEQNGGRAIAVRLIAEDRQVIRRAVDDVRERLGAISVLVNNAAIAQEKPFLEISDDDWDRMFAVNLRGPFACAQEVLPDMLRQ